MRIDRQNEELIWDTYKPMWSHLERDWFGQYLDVPASFALAVDPANLWFFAQRDKRASMLAGTQTNEFVEGLWNHDVAELFVGGSESERYLEFNLAPNGAWWSAEFCGPRKRVNEDAHPVEGITTHSRISDDGCWRAALTIPIVYLKDNFGFGVDTRLNVTFIVDTPAQRFLSAASLPGREPDFHQPSHFERAVTR
ncbi:MAG: hypothetical protein ACPH5P_03735 [Akkermansiaceae bacterium]